MAIDDFLIVFGSKKSDKKKKGMKKESWEEIQNQIDLQKR